MRRVKNDCVLKIYRIRKMVGYSRRMTKAKQISTIILKVGGIYETPGSGQMTL